MINHLQKFSEEDEVLQGTFKSEIFKNDANDELTIYLENSEIVSYAEKCIEHFNSLSSDMVNLICENIIKCFNKFGGINEGFKLPVIDTPKDILKYCWFTTMFIDVPQTDELAYYILGEGDWEECICFTIKGDRVLYVGRDEVSPWECEVHYRILDDNCLYLED
ncbi:MAG: DUF6985 domain-containing protein [Oscillospiraceae bacterium]